MVMISFAEARNANGREGCNGGETGDDKVLLFASNSTPHISFQAHRVSIFKSRDVVNLAQLVVTIFLVEHRLSPAERQRAI